MATKTKKQANKLAKAKAIVKKINNDLIDASFQAIETTVKTGEKWQKLTQRLIKKAEPLTKQQMNMFAETAESIKGQLENGTERLKDLVGFDQVKADALKDKIEKEVSNNKLVKKAEKLTAKLKKDITNTIEDVKEKIEDYTEDIIDDVKEKVEDVIGTKKPAAKKSKAKAKKAPAKKAVAKKVVAKKTTVKKVAVKKVVVVKSKVKNDLKVIKGIGPKLEEALNSVGYTAYEQLAKTTIKDLTKVLSDAGINTKIYDLSGWKAQAKLALKGDMEAVTNWKKK